jgi:curved DNA-binding protein CbpA
MVVSDCIDYYEVLQVSPSAEEEIIQAAFRRLATKWHPDRRPGDVEAAQQMRLINEAYHVLTDQKRRRDYDNRRNRPNKTSDINADYTSPATDSPIADPAPLRGFVYILINQAMPNLVKIGQTDRTPEARAAQLSGDTGVPGRFFVAYAEELLYFVEAEKAIFRRLEQFRWNKKREFFEIPLKDAIQVVQEIAARYREPEPREQKRAETARAEAVEQLATSERLAEWNQNCRKDRTTHFSLAVIILCLLAAISGYFYYLWQQSTSNPGPVSQARQAPEVERLERRIAEVQKDLQAVESQLQQSKSEEQKLLAVWNKPMYTQDAARIRASMKRVKQTIADLEQKRDKLAQNEEQLKHELEEARMVGSTTKAPSMKSAAGPYDHEPNNPYQPKQKSDERRRWIDPRYEHLPKAKSQTR